MTGGALVIAFVATAFATVGLLQAGRSGRRVTALRAELAALEQRMGADESAAAIQRRYVHGVAAKAIGAQRSLQQVSWEVEALPTETEVARLRGELSAYAACIPQLQRELAGLGMSVRIAAGRGRPRSLTPFATRPLSPACSALLAGR